MDNVLLGNRYKIIALIGVGGMAKVYKAFDTLLQREVAVKVLKEQYAEDEEFLKKFSNEAQSAAKLTHINIVSVYDIGNDMINGKKIDYIVMEYVDGQTLKDLIEDEGKLSNHDLVDYSIQIAQALKSAHSFNIVHRDIKPQNILIDNYGLLKVTDFGIARVSTKATITYTSSILGTVHYISPEQAKGKFVDERSDLYSLGVVMYEMATGQVPFDADNSVGIAVMHIQDEPVRPKVLNPELSDRLDGIIMKLLNKDPVNRFTKAEYLINALEDENYHAEELHTEKQTARIPIVNDKENLDDRTELITKQDIKKKKKENTEAVYVSPSNNNNDRKPKRKKRSILPLAFLALVFVAVVAFIVTRPKSDQLEVPTVLNLTEEEAVSELENRGLKANVSRYSESDNYKEGTVMEQDPKAKTKVDEGTTVNLVISQGREETVPDLSNMTVEQAEEKLAEKGLKLGRTSTENSKNIEKDLVIRQSPMSGEKVQSGTEVDLTISLGKDEDEKETVTVPNLENQLENVAETTISNSGLVLGSVTEDYSDTILEGHVISQSIAANVEVVKDTKINIVVSKGEDPDKNNSGTGVEDPSGSDVLDVEVKLTPPSGKDTFNVKIYKLDENENTTDLLYNEDHKASEANSDNKIVLDFKAVEGTKVEVFYDGVSSGVYEVKKW